MTDRLQLLLAIIFSLLLFGCAEGRAERAFKHAVQMEEDRPLPEARDALAEIGKRWPKTKAASKAAQEIEWIDDLLGAAARGPMLRAWDAIRKVSQAVERYRNDHGAWPESLDPLVPRYLAGPELDPWGVPVRYSKRADGYFVVSYGADGIPGGSGVNTDFAIKNGKFVYGGR